MPFYHKLRPPSWFGKPQFLCWVGLFLINTLIAEEQTGPAHYLAQRLQLSPNEEVHDVVSVENVIFVAGTHIYRIDGNSAKIVQRGSRFLALEYAVDQDRVWFAGSEGIGWVSTDGANAGAIEHNFGLIWALRLWEGRLWYAGSREIGWINPNTGEIGGRWEHNFIPRPAVFGPWDSADRLFVASEDGLWEVNPNGLEEVAPSALFEDYLPTWMTPASDGFYFGTSQMVYHWSGYYGEPPTIIETGYKPFFSRGINNGIKYDNRVAIVDYPSGVAIWDAAHGAVTGYVSEESGLDIGEVHKVAHGTGHTMYVMGSAGVATVNMAQRTRFFPAGEVWEGDSPRYAFSHDADLVVFGHDAWHHINELGYVSRQTFRDIQWAGVDMHGIITYGALNTIDRWSNGLWETHMFETPLISVIWTQEGGFATGPEAFYSISTDLSLTPLVPARDHFELIGTFDGAVYALDKENRLTRFRPRGLGWVEDPLPVIFSGQFRGAASLSDALFIAFDTGLHSLTTDGSVTEIPLSADWKPRSIASHGDTVLVALHHARRDQTAIALWDASGKIAMATVPQLDLIGKPAAVAVSGHQVAIVGEDGAFLLPRSELSVIDRPSARFKITADGIPVEATRLAHGSEQIMIEASPNYRGIPVQVEYRMNQGQWRLAAGNPSFIQIGGHGDFHLDVRPVFPNGVAGNVQSTRFSIAPPWFMNPWVQGSIVVCAILTAWLLFYLRNRHIRKLNTWLRSEVKRQTRELEVASEARTNFLAGISHDIRNPLNGILLISDSLSREPPAAERDPRLEELKDLGMVVDRMLGEVLDFTSIDQSSVPLTMGAAGIRDIIHTAVKQNQWGLERSLINVTIKYADPLMEAFIRTDRNWMVQVLSNLIVNAINYANTERIEVGATLLEDGDSTAVIEFHVKDWGIGIDDSEKALVFERFYRGESAHESGRHGTGLGLAICQDIVKAMGGQLGVRDNQPHGTVFFVTNRYQKMVGEAMVDPEEVLSGLNGKSILVVEDLDYNRHAMVQFFKRWGCAVDSSGNGSKALEMLLQKEYHLAIVDWDLPGISGPNIARRFRRARPDSSLIIIALTAYTDAQKKQESYRSGMNGYLAKPMSAQRLALTLAGIEADWKRRVAHPSDTLDTSSVDLAIAEHIDTLITLHESDDFETVRRTAHRLTTLALMSGNNEMQRICRDLQEFARNGESGNVKASLLGLRKWKVD